MFRYDVKKTIPELQSISLTCRYPGQGGVRMVDNDKASRFCQFIEGTPTKQEMRRGDGGYKCMATTQDGSSYCPEHHARCYTKVLTDDLELSPSDE